MIKIILSNNICHNTVINRFLSLVDNKLKNQKRFFMKQIRNPVIFILAFLIVQSGFAQITGSKHDFSNQSWNTSVGKQICIVCHTPHNANASIVNAPLWNHQTTATASFTLYASSTLNATMSQPDASSKLCLSCHDGTVAIENFGTITNGTTLLTGVYNIGTNLGNDHPVSFTYDAALATADKGLKNPTTATGIGTGTIQATMLFSDKMQCASCHDVHNTSGFTAGLLTKSNAASALCLTCHSK